VEICGGGGRRGRRAILAGGGFAPPGAQAQQPEDVGEVGGTVVLPTGDAVTVLPGDRCDRAGRGARGDGVRDAAMLDRLEEFIAVPFDQVAEIEAGLEDPRLYGREDLVRRRWRPPRLTLYGTFAGRGCRWLRRRVRKPG
jgi:hypothetical protein